MDLCWAVHHLRKSSVVSRPAKGARKLLPKPVRLTQEGHDFVAQAASIKGITPAEFRRDAVLEAALDVVLQAAVP